MGHLCKMPREATAKLTQTSTKGPDLLCLARFHRHDVLSVENHTKVQYGQAGGFGHFSSFQAQTEK